MLVHQNVYREGSPPRQLSSADLFILQAYRSPQLVRRIYQEVERLCLAQNIRLVLALPNENATLLNARFLKLVPCSGCGLGWVGLVATRFKAELFRPLQIDAKEQAVDLIVGLCHAGNREWAALGRRDSV